jgi:hypothetical protein
MEDNFEGFGEGSSLMMKEGCPSLEHRYSEIAWRAGSVWM